MQNTTTIPGHGAYTYAVDIYTMLMESRTRAELYADVKVATEDMGITGLSKLRKFELAAMVAEWETTTRQNMWDAERARYANMCKLEKGAMTCLAPKGHDGLCTDIQGTRFEGTRFTTLAEHNARTNTPEVKDTPFANLFKVVIAGETVGHVSYRPDTGTWNAYRHAGEEDLWVGFGWIRSDAVESLIQTFGNLHNLA